MQLFLDAYGGYLNVRNGMFRVGSQQQTPTDIPVREVQALFLAKGVSVSTNALLLALENQIPVIFLDGLDHPIGLVWSARYGSIATIRRRQATFGLEDRGWIWLREELLGRLESQRCFIQALAERFPEKDELQRYAGRAENLFGYLRGQFGTWQPGLIPLDTEALGKRFRGWEGVASKLTLACIAAVLPGEWTFRGRSKRPAEDPFNALLNYAFGILYGQVELALVKAGLDPYMGVLHIDRHQQPTLVFDVIERYRIWAERFVTDWFLSGKPRQDHFMALESGGIWLSPEGKRAFVPEFFAYLREPAETGLAIRRKRLAQIDLDQLQLATRIRGE